MNVVAATSAPSGTLPGLPADLAAAVLWFLGKLVRLVGWRLTGHPRAACATDVQRYLNRSVRRFLKVLERFAAGEVFRTRASRAGAVRTAPAAPRVRLPMEFGWVARLGEDVRMAAAMIGHHLNRTEVSALIAACPQAQRVLRPVCHLLAIDAPCVGRLVRKRRVRSQAGATPSPRPWSAPQPKPANAGEGDEATRARTQAGALLSPHPWSASQPKPASAGEGEGKRRWLTRKEREEALWYPNLEGKPMTLLPRKLPRD